MCIRDSYKDIEKAYMDALAAFEKYESTTKAVAANREAHRYALEKYMACLLYTSFTNGLTHQV